MDLEGSTNVRCLTADVFFCFKPWQLGGEHPAAMPPEHQLEEHSREASKSGKMHLGFEKRGTKFKTNHTKKYQKIISKILTSFQHAKLCALWWGRSPSFMLRRPYADPMLLVGLTSIPVFDLVWYVRWHIKQDQSALVRWWTVRGQDNNSL